ncbi:hypothetical protein [Actinoplanes flavus]|uniref:Uncharacterized protein n=1 Tax=Actinoplanes flavus TaxID=2820290 RepID=A0ABS3UCZ2_9ACTN|nr:hypothetical protein [Actinoplanes flavus]MBO3736649.1 hypothetical protein [Actinoplanes flavus]
MTQNVTDQITSATPDDPSSAAERPTAPEGSVYLSDVLARIRQHATDNSWCGTAESVTLQVLNDGLSFKPRRRENTGCANRTCTVCYPGGVAETNIDAADERFTAADGTDPFVTKARLKMAIRKAVDLGYNEAEYRRLYRELIDIYQLDAVELPVTTHTVTFTVTDEQLHGRPADQSGIASALESGTVAGFTVSSESAEKATATLMP